MEGSEAGGLLIRGAEVAGRAPVDLRIEGECIAAIAPRLERRRGEPTLDARGGALLPGLHDHHLHLFALAAALASVRCGPPEVRSREELIRALRAAEGSEIRGVGYHESVAGELDRGALDAVVGDRPLRIQHRSGALWMLNTPALRKAGLGASGDGRLFDGDARLRERSSFPALAEVGDRLLRCGVAGATDATVSNGASEIGAFERAIEKRELPQRLLVMGTHELPDPQSPRIERGPLKVVLREAALPELGELAEKVRAAHAAGRAVAVHCVTRTELLFALAAFEGAGPVPGDRLEHASVAPPEAITQIARLGLTVVTQPNFILERGDTYATDVDVRDRPWLYRGQGFVAAGVPLGAGTDAPFGDPDPWRAMQAAVERRSADGQVLGADEALSPERALALFTSFPEAPGGPPRRVAVGRVADLCLLDRPWAAARERLSSDCVRGTFIAGLPRFDPSA